MDKIRDLLGKQDRSEPVEVRLIKEFVRSHFKADVKVTVHPQNITIFAANAALAGTLRLHSYQIAEACQTDKRLVFRIG